MDTIKFGTDGWRAIIAKEFTYNNVARVTAGVAEWLKEYYAAPKVVLGFDCRFSGQDFANHIADILDFHGIEVILYSKPITTPAISLAVKELNCSLGIILTASHNPPNYQGYKLKGEFGGPLLGEDISAIEALIPDEVNYRLSNYERIITTEVDLKELYLQRVREQFDVDSLNKSDLKIAYDAMYGSGQFVVKELLPNASHFRCEWNPHFFGLSPEPILKNLGEFVEFLKSNPGHHFALVNDGDADRIGLLDGEGNFIDSHTILLLLMHYYVNYKKQSGKIATGFSSTVKIAQFCKLHNLELEIVPIGFKHICKLMTTQNILVGGEESGGIAVAGHVPERDGIWIGMVLLQFMLESNKSLQELIAEVKAEVGDFGYQRIDLKVSETVKANIIEKCAQGEFTKFGELTVSNTDTLDGFKYFFNQDEWLLIRPSGTEPVLRTYAEGTSLERAKYILEQCHKEIL